MCRETKREPAWVSAIRVALLEGRVTVDSVIEEANLVAGRERTVRDVLSTMADRELLVPTGDGGDAYLPGPVLLESDRFGLDFDRASDGGAHRWNSSV
ncbi:hypothetical protein [Halobacterium jilantaiense]|uniref:Uncharacterized protein n=1 Tax=Halobacterium jilantaiense TaxID=355548 RepID=A0A1I0QLK1_9EURY|nr:hypothetical protein [Halobacterium jilantaiense]SEW28156.1 hypothetical protein SAMN04487945_2724 [Halobacterium jilantaiense]